MPELRWALLLAGLLFVAGLVVWERRKRRARDAERMPPPMTPSLSTPTGHDAGGGRGGRDPGGDPGGREEPTFSMPDLPRRDPVRDLPIVEIGPRSQAGPGVGDLPVFDMAQSNRGGTGGLPNESWEAVRVDPAPAEPSTEAAGGDYSRSPDDVGTGAADPRAAAQPDPVERASAWLADSVPTELPQKPVLDWPPEDQRRIVALRVVPRPGEKFNGATLRQALVGEGFVHGELDIYHKPIGDGRVVLSAASLTRPGTFDPRTIDGLLFGGLNLFAVLPGPLPPRETVERLCLAGRTLAQRLRGDTLDSRGQPLTEARVAEMRREAADGAS
jgi:ZipA, C-terminal FtsZ-binding domain